MNYRYGTVLHGTVRYGTVRYGTARHGTVRYGNFRYLLHSSSSVVDSNLLNFDNYRTVGTYVLEYKYL